MRLLLTSLLCLSFLTLASAEPPRVLPQGKLPDDQRLSELRTLDSYFPFQHVADPSQWPARQAEIRQRILLSQGLWPLPTRSDLNAVVHGRVERDDYVIDRVYFQSIPGHFVTGSLYRPKGKPGPYPAILSPHGHWNEGRFYDAGENQIRADLAQGAERFEVGGRYPIQARAVQLARMGCVVFVYDMTGNADSIQIGHRPDKASHLDRKTDWGFFSAQAELRLQNMMGLQTWNSIRAVDFVSELDQIDTNRIGVTGASGGGTQSMILAAIDERIAAAMPCVMVSTSMQGGCTCENAPYLRIDQGNVDIAAAIAPRPLGITAADDWTVELQTKGYPDLLQLYASLGHKNRLTAAFNLHFKHNYNHVNRTVMYGFFNRHFQLGFDEPILERDYVPLSRDEATVWTKDHPAPTGDAIGDAHEVKLLKIADKDAADRMADLVPTAAAEIADYQRVVGGAWATILGRSLDEVREVRFDKTGESTVDGIPLTVGLLKHSGEQLPMAQIGNADGKRTLVWITDRGKQGLFDGENIDPTLVHLARNGCRIISVDLSGQGEFLPDGQPIQTQRMWYQRNGERAWERFSGYTYGYNHPLFVKRVHDVLTAIRYATSDNDSFVDLIGLGPQAGPIVAAARSQSGQAINRTYVDLNQFRFETLTRQNDPMFVPGAVKYLDVDGLLSLCVPGNVEIAGAEVPVTTRIADLSGSIQSLHRHRTSDDLITAIRKP